MATRRNQQAADGADRERAWQRSAEAQLRIAKYQGKSDRGTR